MMVRVDLFMGVKEEIIKEIIIMVEGCDNQLIIVVVMTLVK